MAILSNINGKFAVDSTGAIQLSGSAGTANYVLVSGGAAAAPTWVAASTVIGGPYLPLSGGTLTGATATSTGISFTVGGVLTTQGDAYLENNVYVGNTSNEFLETRYNSTSDYAARYTWKGLQFGNNGINRIVAGRTAVGGYLNFYVNNTNDGLANTPDGTLALTLAADATATFAGSVAIEKSGSAVLSVYSTDTGVVSTEKTFIKLYGENGLGTKIEQARISTSPGASGTSEGQLIFSTGTGVYSGV